VTRGKRPPSPRHPAPRYDLRVIAECPHCHARYRLDPSRLRDGRGRLQCVKCREIFPVSATDGAAIASDSPPPRARHGLDVSLAALSPGPFRQLVVGVLARCGARSVAVDDGPGALEVARRTRPRVVALHAWLRGLSGLEVARVLREDPALGTSRILLLGGPAPCGRFAPDPARVHGVDAWLPDTASPAELEAVLRQLLGRDAGPPQLEDEEAVRAWARLAASDFVLCEADAVDAHLATGSPDREALVGPLRGAGLERFPMAGAAGRRAVGAILDSEIDAALEARRAARSR